MGKRSGSNACPLRSGANQYITLRSTCSGRLSSRSTAGAQGPAVTTRRPAVYVARDVVTSTRSTDALHRPTASSKCNTAPAAAAPSRWARTQASGNSTPALGSCTATVDGGNRNGGNRRCTSSALMSSCGRRWVRALASAPWTSTPSCPNHQATGHDEEAFSGLLLQPPPQFVGPLNQRDVVGVFKVGFP